VVGVAGLDAGGDGDVVGAAEVGLLDTVEDAIDGKRREAVFFRPLANGFALAAKPGLEGVGCFVQFACVALNGGRQLIEPSDVAGSG
jgi:hypothetical protein